MAEVDNITYDEVGPDLNTRRFRCQLTGATSTISSTTHKFGRSINAVLIVQEGTNTMTYTRSSTTVTVTGTNDDWVNCIVTGR